MSTRLASQCTLCRICSRSSPSRDVAREPRVHRREPDRALVLVVEAARRLDRRRDHAAQFRDPSAGRRGRCAQGRAHAATSEQDGTAAGGWRRMARRSGLRDSPHCSRRKATTPSTGTSAAWPSRRRLYSSTPRSRPLSPTTMRCGMPTSSSSANLTPGRASRSSSSTSKPGGGEFGVQRFGGLLHACGLLQVDRDERHVEGRDRLRPDDAALIVILFDRRRHDARHTDAIAPHRHRRPTCPARRAPWRSWPRCTCGRAGRCDRPRCRGRCASVPWPVGLGSPATTLRTSTTSPSGRSRPQLTPVRCASRSLAPQTKSASLRRRTVDVDLAARARRGR